MRGQVQASRLQGKEDFTPGFFGTAIPRWGVFKTRPFWNPDLKVVSSDGSTKHLSLFK